MRKKSRERRPRPQASHTAGVYTSIKLWTKDHDSFKSMAPKFNASMVEILAAARRLMEKASPEQKIQALREVREPVLDAAAA